LEQVQLLLQLVKQCVVDVFSNLFSELHMVYVTAQSNSSGISTAVDIADSLLELLLVRESAFQGLRPCLDAEHLATVSRCWRHRCTYHVALFIV
jgi:hypothetical protein